MNTDQPSVEDGIKKQNDAIFKAQQEYREIFKAQQEYRAFVATDAGRAFVAFCNSLVAETMYGEKEYPSERKLRDLSDRTIAHKITLVAEIKRLQASEVDLFAALIAWRDQETSGLIASGGMDRVRGLRDATIVKATGDAS
jgi:hypothetical protein